MRSADDRAWLVAAPHSVGGSQVPLAVFALATAYLMAGNLSAYGYPGLTQGARAPARLFGDDALRAAYMAPLHRQVDRHDGARSSRRPARACRHHDETASRLATATTRARAGSSSPAAITTSPTTSST
jgi:hypothetical protein